MEDSIKLFQKLYDLTYVVRSKPRGLEIKTTIFNDFLCFLICNVDVLFKPYIAFIRSII